MIDANYWIEKLQLSPHPEGGYYKEVYRSENEIDILSTDGKTSLKRNSLTSIYFLLKCEDFSHFHILSSDEIWYFHSGQSAIIHFIDKKGQYFTKTINSENLQVTIPHETFFAAELTSKNDNDYILVSCAVAPGFDFEDFRMASKSELITLCPNQKQLINQLTIS
ncbi:MAG: cupin domain-containing protein [Salibacteraceae bacterium]